MIDNINVLNDIFINYLYVLPIFSLLVFAQKRSSHILGILMAVSFYLQAILGVLIFTTAPFDGVVRYWVGTAHPVFRLPVFFMGVCAGVLCVRIQQGDLDAFHSTKRMFFTLFYNRGVFSEYCVHST